MRIVRFAIRGSRRCSDRVRVRQRSAIATQSADTCESRMRRRRLRVGHAISRDRPGWPSALSGCSYNKFSTQEEAINAQWAEVQNQLQRRNDLIPESGRHGQGLRGARGGRLQGDRRLALASCWRRSRPRKPSRRRTSRPPRSAGCSPSSRTTRISRPTRSSCACRTSSPEPRTACRSRACATTRPCRNTTRSGGSSRPT